MGTNTFIRPCRIKQLSFRTTSTFGIKVIPFFHVVYSPEAGISSQSEDKMMDICGMIGENDDRTRTLSFCDAFLIVMTCDERVSGVGLKFRGK